MAIALVLVAVAILVLAAVIVATSQGPAQVEVAFPTACTEVIGGEAGIPAPEVPCSQP